MRKRKIVLDSSVIVKFLFAMGEDNLSQADTLLADVENEEVLLVAPVLTKYEVGNVVRFRKISEVEKLASWDNFEQLPIKYIDLDFSEGRRAQSIAEALNITFYDAVFVELAERLEAVLVTANPKHQKKFGGVKVIALKDYK